MSGSRIGLSGGRIGRPRNSLSGSTWDDFISAITGVPAPSTVGPNQDQQIAGCLATANQQTARLDAKTADVIKTWNPTGFYTATDIRTAVASTMELVGEAQSALDNVRGQANSSQDALMGASGILMDAGQKSLVYLQAANDADAQGIQTINSPWLKRWVTNTMTDVSNALVTASVVACGIPAWLTVLQAFQGFFDKLASVVKAIVGIVLKVGEAVLEIPDDIAKLWTVLKWGAVLGGAAWLIMKFQEHKSGHAP